MLASLAAAPLQAGIVLPETIFQSGFEAIEACIDFDGLGDAVIVPVVNISGDFSLNGGAFPAEEYDDANISLRDRITGSEFAIGNTHDQSYSVNIIPGRYDVLYSVETPGDGAPHNTGALLMENVDLSASGTLDIPVTSYLVGGDFSWNGAPFPASEFNDAVIFLDGETTGRLDLGETKLQSFSGVPVLPGAYDVRYQLESAGTVPWNEWGLVGQVVVSGNNPSMDINVTSIELSGTFMHNGAAFPAVEFDDGNFYLHTVTGDRAFLENSHSQSFQKHVIPGSYDLYWELETAGGTVPSNLRARIGEDIDIAGGNLAVNMISHNLSGDFTLNGGAFPASDQQTGRMILRDPATGIVTVLGLTHEGSYDRRIIAGNYDIGYRHVQGLQVPQNTDALLGQAIVNSDATLDIDMTAATFSASVNHNGVLFPAQPMQSANILVRDKDTPDWALVGNTSEQTVTALLATDTYDVYYVHVAGDEIPRNVFAVIHEGLVVESPPVLLSQPLGGGFQLDVDSVLITGQMLLNDAPMPALETDDGVLSFIRGFNSVRIGNTHDQSYQVRLIDEPEPTLYLVHYAVETPGDSVPLNGSGYVMCVVLDPVPF